MMVVFSECVVLENKTKKKVFTAACYTAPCGLANLCAVTSLEVAKNNYVGFQKGCYSWKIFSVTGLGCWGFDIVLCLREKQNVEKENAAKTHAVKLPVLVFFLPALLANTNNSQSAINSGYPLYLKSKKIHSSRSGGHTHPASGRSQASVRLVPRGYTNDCVHSRFSQVVNKNLGVPLTFLVVLIKTSQQPRYRHSHLALGQTKWKSLLSF